MYRSRRYKARAQKGANKPPSEIKFRLRCCNKLHTIVLNPKGQLILKDHPDLKAELMMQTLSKDESPCLRIMREWRDWQPRRGNSTDIPNELKVARLTAIEVNRDRHSKHYEDADDFKVIAQTRSEYLKGDPGHGHKNHDGLVDKKTFPMSLDRIHKDFVHEVYTKMVKPMAQKYGFAVSDPDVDNMEFNSYDDMLLNKTAHKPDEVDHCRVDLSMKYGCGWSNTYGLSWRICTDRLPLQWYRLFKEGKHFMPTSLYDSNKPMMLVLTRHDDRGLGLVLREEGFTKSCRRKPGQPEPPKWRAEWDVVRYAIRSTYEREWAMVERPVQENQKLTK